MTDLPLDAPVYLLKGDDEVLLQDMTRSLVHELVGDEDRTLVVEELDAARYEAPSGDLHIGPLVDAARTPPFLTARRVVVGRHLGTFGSTDAVAPLIQYLADPLPSTCLVLVWEKTPKPGARLGRIPTKLTDAVKKAGGRVVETGAASGKGREGWLDEQLANGGLKLDAGARRRLIDQVGDDANLVVGLVSTLVGVFGAGTRLTADDIGPYLGNQGAVKPYELTDAIDKGDVALALERLRRILDGGGWHPLQVMATLTNHYVRMLALDGAGVGDEKAAAELLGMKGSTFPARKALEQSRRLGSERLAEFTGLLAQADLDLRGAKAWPSDLVVEVLVARLASRTPRAGAGRSGGGSRSRSGAGRR